MLSPKDYQEGGRFVGSVALGSALLWGITRALRHKTNTNKLDGIETDYLHQDLELYQEFYELQNYRHLDGSAFLSAVIDADYIAMMAHNFDTKQLTPSEEDATILMGRKKAVNNALTVLGKAAIAAGDAKAVALIQQSRKVIVERLTSLVLPTLNQVFRHL